jgi:hypothetical protein
MNKNQSKDAEISKLEQELKHTQENVGALFTQKTHLEQQINVSVESQKQRIQDLEADNLRLLQLVNEKEKTILGISGKFDQVSQRFFFSCAIALKLNANLSGFKCNVDVNELYSEAIAAGIPFEKWDTFTALKMQESMVTESLREPKKEISKTKKNGKK